MSTLGPGERQSDVVVVFETHATTLDNEAGLASGWFDVPLSPTGEQQAHALGKRRRTDDFAVVFCSDLNRSKSTAEIAFAGRNVSVIPDARLRECDYGAFTRRPVAEIEPCRGLYVERPYPEGESYREVVARVAGWLNETTDQLVGSAVLVIGHRGTFYALEHLLGNVPLEEAVAAPWQWRPGWTYRYTSSQLDPSSRWP